MKNNLLETEFWQEDEEEFTPKYTLVGVNGNVFAVLAYVSECMRKEGHPRQEIQEFTSNCLNGGYDYNQIICMCADKIDELNNNM